MRLHMKVEVIISNAAHIFHLVHALGGIVNKTIAISVAKALIKRYLEINLNHIDLGESSWAQTLFGRMKF